MTLAALLAFSTISFLIVIVPGPSVTVIVANSLRDGARAGMMTIAGTQAGLVPMVLIVALGLETVVAFMAEWFFVVKMVGAAYLIWLGIKLWRSDGDLGKADTKRPGTGYFWQGAVVIWSNPKALILFGAIIPQFVDPAGSAFWQATILGLLFMTIATIFDSMYALLGRTRGAVTDP